jgi:cell division protease FtsH
VLTPAELAAQQNGHLPPPAAPDPGVQEKIDEAASVGAHPLAEEHPAVEVIEVPDDKPVKPDEKA